jgi:hypothetical protein
MSIRTKKSEFPFPVADTNEGPSISWKDFSLTLEFTTYQDLKCKILFENVSHFEFLSEDEIDAKIYPYDNVVELVESPIIEKLVSVGEIGREESKSSKHIHIGFNEISSNLSIVYEKLKVLEGL